MIRTRAAVSVVAILFLLAAMGGPAPAAGILHDTRTITGSVGGADDLTVRVTNASVSHAAVRPNDSGRVVVTLRLDHPGAVDASRVTASVDGHDLPTTVDCDATCTVRLPAAAVASAASTGDHSLRITGWWEYDRRFVATIPVSVEPPRDRRTGTTTGGTTNATTTTPRNATTRTNTTTGPTSTTTSGPSSTTTTSAATTTTTTATNATTTSTTSTTRASTTEKETKTTTQTTSTTTTENATTTTQTTSSTTVSGNETAT